MSMACMVLRNGWVQSLMGLQQFLVGLPRDEQAVREGSSKLRLRVFWQMLIPVEQQSWVHSKESSTQLRQISICRDARTWPNPLSQLASLEWREHLMQSRGHGLTFLL